MRDDIGDLVEWLEGESHERITNPDERARWIRAINKEAADASLWRVIEELIGRGYHSMEWDYDSDAEELSLSCYDKRVVGEDTDDCLKKMLEATND